MSMNSEEFFHSSDELSDVSAMIDREEEAERVAAVAAARKVPMLEDSLAAELETVLDDHLPLDFTVNGQRYSLDWAGEELVDQDGHLYSVEVLVRLNRVKADPDPEPEDRSEPVQPGRLRGVLPAPRHEHHRDRERAAVDVPGVQRGRGSRPRSSAAVDAAAGGGGDPAPPRRGQGRVREVRVHLRDRAVVLTEAVVWDVDKAALRVYDGVDWATRQVLLIAASGGWTAIEPRYRLCATPGCVLRAGHEGECDIR